MPITVKAADAAQFLSLVPRLLGCVPTQSLVIVPMAGGRSLGALRVDLPPDELVHAVAASVVGMLRRIADAEACVVVVYADAALPDSAASPPVLPHRALVDAIDARVAGAGLRVIDALTVANDAWGSHFDPSLPARGRPLDALRAPIAADDIGPEPSGDQAAGAVLPKVGAAERRATRQAFDALGSALDVLCGIPAVPGPAERIDPAALEAACAVDDLPALFEKALTWSDEPAPMRAALLGWCLARPSLRDVALVQWASDAAGGDAAMEAQRRWEDGADYPSDLASVMWGEGARPDPMRLERALGLVRTVAALLPKARRPGPLAVCAWLSWALGRSSHANRYAGMALAIDRRHGLAEIVRSFVQASHLPDWAFRAT